MSPDKPAAPWKEEKFRDFVLKSGFSEAALDGILGFVAAKKEIKPSAAEELDGLFMSFMGDDLSLASVARMITAQGYETVNHMNQYIETYLDGRPSRIYVGTDEVPTPAGRFRYTAFGKWNVSVRDDGVDFYPIFCIGVLRSVDPMFNKDL